MEQSIIEVGKTITITEKHDRNKLNEGRNYQMGYAFLKNLGDGKFDTTHAITACREYLNEVVWIETHKKEIGNTHGLCYKPMNIFDDVEHVYFALKILPKQHGGAGYNLLDADRKNLRENYKNVEALMNHVEKKLQVTDLTTIEVTSDDPDMFLVTFSLDWIKGSNLISLYSQLLRCAQYWDGKMNIDTFLETFDHPMDKGLWGGSYSGSTSGALYKYNYMIAKGKLVPHLLPKEDDKGKQPGNYTIHQAGIVAWTLPVDMPRIEQGVEKSIATTI